METKVNFRIQCGWNNWRKVTGVLCDRRVPVKVKGKVHKAVVRPAMTYGLEAAPLKKNEEKLDVAEMKMLRWMVGVTRRDQIRNEYIRGTVKVTEISQEDPGIEIEVVWTLGKKSWARSCRKGSHGNGSAWK